MHTDSKLKVYLVLLTLHTSLLIASNAAGAKLFALPFGLAASATVISYMLTFVTLDAIAELYGRDSSRFVINIGLASLAVSVLFFQIAIHLPPATGWPDQAAYESTLGASWRIFLGGWMAYMFSQHFDLWSFLALKETRFGRSLAVRSWISTIIGQLLDTIIFITIAFWGTFPLAEAIAGQYAIKLAFATLGTPFVILLVRVGRHFIARENGFRSAS